MASDRAAQFLNAILCVFVAYVGWRCLNYASGVLLPSDSAIFVNVAYHLIHGKLLYLDVREHKQPIVFVINALALKLGDGTFNSVRVVERFFAVGVAIAFFVITVRTFVSSWIAAAFTLIFLVYFYSPTTFSMGNFPEEYGTVIVVFGVLCTIEAVRRENAPLTILSGVFFSASVLTKEPFLLSTLPWIAYSVLNRDGRLRRFTLFAAGAAIPLLIFLIYLVLSGTLLSWFDMVYFTFGMAAGETITHDPILFKLKRSAHVFATFVWFIRTVDVFFVMGVISVFQKSFLEKFRYVPAVLPVWFIMGLLAANSQHMHANHYYIQVMPGFIMTAACGAAFMVFNLRRATGGVIAGAVVILFLILSLLFLDNTATRAGFNMLTKYPPSSVAAEPISLYIKEHTNDNDTVWVPSYDKYIYLQSGRLSASKYVYLLNHFFFLPSIKGTTQQRMLSLYDDLKKNPPAFIFLKRDEELDYLSPGGIPQWIKANYTLDTTWYDGLLLRRN